MTLRLWVAAWVVLSTAIVVLGFIVNEPLLMAVLVAAPPALASILVCRRIDTARDLWLPECFTMALLVRWLAATFIHYVIYPSRPYLFAFDEGGYDAMGMELSRYLNNYLHDPMYSPVQAGIVWMVGGCYYLVGHVVLLPKLINGLIGAWVAVFTALLGAHMTSAAVGKRAGIMAAVFPSLVLWGAILVKDMHTLLGTLMCLYAVAKLADRGDVRHLASIAVGLGLVIANRPYQGMFVAVGMLAAYFSTRTQASMRLRTWIMTAILFAVVAVMLSGVFAELVSPFGDQEALTDRVNQIRHGYTDADSALDLTGYDTTTPLGLLAWLPFGVSALYLAPIPFTGSSTISYGTSPEMLLWYWLLPSVFRGFRAAYRSGALKAMVGPLVYVAVASIGWATVVTNVGSLYRYRAQTLFLPLIFIALHQIRKKEERLTRSADVDETVHIEAHLGGLH